MNSLDFFFEGLSPSKTKEILELEDVPFSFLVRKIGKENVVSFLDVKSNVQHQILPVRHDSSLFRHHPHLQHQGPLGVFNFLRSISTDWLHPVIMTDEMRNQINDSSESWISDICRICGCVNPSKNHSDSHRIVFCQPCNKVVPKNVKGNHKCLSHSCVGSAVRVGRQLPGRLLCSVISNMRRHQLTLSVRPKTKHKS